ncbi:hypothetical protein F53441_14025 [Fusarium austroafricanum]|uniref:Uncharacterized protein n=1 Tax=Fusarium austroafricanum TaxID=2364996 RepID=A0A8H4JHU0_9HYPO|nr:hypothetical protein F53441_14025 [Fusarium austroafricanum]
MHYNSYNAAATTIATTCRLPILFLLNCTNTDSKQNIESESLHCKNACSYYYPLHLRRSGRDFFAAETEPYSVYLYEDEECKKQVSSVGDDVAVDYEDLESKFSVPIRSFKFEHPNAGPLRCGFQLGIRKDTNTCTSYDPYSFSGHCYRFLGNPGVPRPAIKSWFAWKFPCPE